MKNLFAILIIITVCQSCTHHNGNIKNVNLNKYTLTIYQDKFDPSTNKFKPNNVIDSMSADNDTVAYLTVLKRFYNQKITERANYNYGQPKSFLILDKNGIDLKVKLSERIVTGLKNQVENTPNVKKMLDDYNRDSLYTDTTKVR
ncbi:hypothetical protein KXD93_22650 [Mucilaginibacter sp. BJC16-A38]|uniref:hypothetical protein n=1 Tax=Mucilaginibacter phenanthrenivorans TaxID=1234842 RepID=UPI0021570276|nr:hypothetical protein [Mucilaginibacter phenanthrenivorans]MCR8560472.1 hypothetical protein [Mucilaginibacter phenanthrenivorans]